MDVVLEVAQKHNLLVIENSYDALGSRFVGRLVGLLASLEL
jgi:dTDP-4-amino-4,6-dideoxygalactose transaminase